MSKTTNPYIIGRLDTPDDAYGISLSRDEYTVFLGGGKSGLLVIDVSDTTNPYIIGNIRTLGSAFGVKISSDD